MHNAYLHKALRSFEACCKPSNNAVFIFGHSLADNDKHVLRCITSGAAQNLAVGIYGDPNTQANKTVIQNATALVAQRARKRAGNPLNLIFYDAASAKVWG
jgi:hypothetical protein